jgi:uncharacterized protein DUF1203
MRQATRQLCGLIPRAAGRCDAACGNPLQASVRAYDREGRIAGGVMVNDGEHAMTVIRELLAGPNVSLVHLRNVGYGCYNFAVRRS